MDTLPSGVRPGPSATAFLGTVADPASRDLYPSLDLQEEASGAPSVLFPPITKGSASMENR